MRVLNIVECAYRATIEKQDDSVLWFVRALAVQAGAEIVVLLRGNAVNYLNRRQHVEKLRIGQTEIAHPPRLCDEVDNLIQGNVPVYYIEDDAGERGLERIDMLPGARPVARNALAQFVGRFERVFHW